MSIAFSTLDECIVVSENADGSLSWSGKYRGASIERAIPIDGGKRCVLLLDPDASQRSVFENLLCIDRSEKPIWFAKLLGNPDCFVRVDQTDEGILANTFSGWRVVLDQNTGMQLKTVFTK
jgi:hypothetical protein